MKDSWRHFTAEFIGTFALVFVGGGAIITSMGMPPQVALLQIALAHGLILGITITATMRISGHFNPAVTLGLLAGGRVKGGDVLPYIIAQLIGATLAAAALSYIASGNGTDAVAGGLAANGVGDHSPGHY